MSNVTREDFVSKWMEAYKNGKNQAWVARELGVSRSTVTTRANRLRKSNVELPDLRTARSSYLNKIIEKES